MLCCCLMRQIVHFHSNQKYIHKCISTYNESIMKSHTNHKMFESIGKLISTLWLSSFTLHFNFIYFILFYFIYANHHYPFFPITFDILLHSTDTDTMLFNLLFTSLCGFYLIYRVFVHLMNALISSSIWLLVRLKTINSVLLLLHRTFTN